jgi:hypothetical protein
VRRAVPIALFLLATIGVEGHAGEEEAVGRPYPWHADNDTIFLRRIVHAATGRPVANAEVRLYAEVPHPLADFGRPSATTRSDDAGWARIQRSDLDTTSVATYGEPNWAYVEAPELTPVDERGSPLVTDDPDLPLYPATTLRLALVDPLNRPVADALVGWFLGCGHTPDARQARTDPSGVATLPGVGLRSEGRLWPVAEGLESRYVGDFAWAPWQRARTARLDWAPVVEGRVLRADGEPAIGVGVGANQCHRGPWARTDAQGRFRVLGLDASGTSLTVEAAEYPVGPKSPLEPWQVLSVDRPPPGFPLVVRLPAEGVEHKAPASVARLVVRILHDRWPPGPKASVHVVAVRREDGWIAEDWIGGEGDEAPRDIVSLDVPAGAYEVIASARRGRGVSFSRASASVEARAGSVPVVVSLPAPRLLRLVVPPAADLVCTLTTEGESERFAIDPESGSDDLWVPATGPLYLRVEQPKRTRLVAVDRPASTTADPVVLTVPVFEPVEVRARLVDADGAPARGHVLELDVDPELAEPPDGPPSEAPSARVLSGEGITLVVWPEERSGLLPTFVEVSFLKPGSPRDLGTIVLPRRTPTLRVLAASGEPLSVEAILVTRNDRAEDVTLDEAGAALDPWHAPGLLLEGAVVRVPAWRRNGLAPAARHEAAYVRRLEGRGPWTLRPPTGVITVTPSRTDGESLARWSLFLDGRRYGIEGPTATLTNVELGPHEIVVDVVGATPVRRQSTVVEGESLSWSPRLQPVR